ncbi:MAG TPA: LCP family protein [Clostridia bacterium]|nr:LCP family protein [Clostridia bacterium]
MLGGSNEGPQASSRPGFAWRRVLPLVVVALVVVLVATSVRLGIAAHRIAPRTSPSDLLSLVITPGGKAGSLEQRISSDQRINVLLMAYGGTGGDDPNYTDTMIVVSIRPSSGAAAVIAMPRYLWVRIPAPATGDIEGKIYAAYALGVTQNSQFLRPRWLTPTGPGDLAAATVSETIGQPIDYWVAIDSAAFEAVIDALGGVRINVPVALDDRNYPVGDAGLTTHIHFDAGLQTLNGLRAEEYARSRLSTSETDRALRQELVLFGILQSLRSPHLGLGIVWSIGPLENGLRTNLVPLEMRELAQLVTRVREADIKRISLEDSGLLDQRMLDTAPILIPHDSTYQALHDFIESQLP